MSIIVIVLFRYKSYYGVVAKENFVYPRVLICISKMTLFETFLELHEVLEQSYKNNLD